jgi:hypothetical protein
VANKRRSGARAERLALIADDLALDMTVRQIAAKYDISPTQAHKDIREIKADWLASRNEAVEQARAQHSARLARYIREMWDAWFASKGVQISTTERQKPGPPVFESPGPGLVPGGFIAPDVETQGSPITTSIIKESSISHGDPKYAERIADAYDQLAKINGLYAAKEIHLNVTRYLEGVAEELGIDPSDLLEQAEEVAETAWKQSGATSGR